MSTQAGEGARILIVMGTRPEVIKQAPVYLALSEQPRLFRPITLATGQHDALFADALSAFAMPIHHQLPPPAPGRSLNDAAAAIMSGLQAVLMADRPDYILVQGDTLSTFLGALAGFYAGIPVGHVEAGLRTHDLTQPFPEEANRRLVGVIADLHFAPTAQARANLLAEGVASARIHMTGNTAIDAIQRVTGPSAGPVDLPAELVARLADRRYVLLTLHRRESFGEPFAQMLAGIRDFAQAHPELMLVFPIHPNPQVAAQVEPVLGALANVCLVPPLGYRAFARLLADCHFVITDSGGIQEEAPALGKPVLVLREQTERGEAVDCGAAWLAGSDRTRIAELASWIHTRLLAGELGGLASPFGDGRAAARIVSALSRRLHLT